LGEIVNLGRNYFPRGSQRTWQYIM
jgi:hypothetical protein